MKALLAVLLTLLLSLTSAIAQTGITVKVTGAIPDRKLLGDDAAKSSVAIVRLRADATILDALVAVGGVGRAGIPGDIRLIRKNGAEDASNTPIRINAVKELKSPESASRLLDGDVVYIPEIVEDFGPPEFFNSLLWGWGVFRLQNRDPSVEWRDLCQHLDATHRRGGDDRLGPWIDRERRQAVEDYIRDHPVTKH